MKQCPFCAEDIQDAAIVCKHCGRNLSSKTNQPPATTSPTSSTTGTANRNAALGCLTLFIIAFGFCVYIVTPSEQQRVQQAKDDTRIEAYVSCQQFVEQRLRSPSSATFPTYGPQFTLDMGGGKWRIDAYVDSQNAFGAMLRNNFTCVVQRTGGQWKLAELSLKEK